MFPKWTGRVSGGAEPAVPPAAIEGCRFGKEMQEDVEHF